MEEFGGLDEFGVGFGIGLEWLILLLGDEGVELLMEDGLDVYVVGIGEVINLESFWLVIVVWDVGLVVECDYLNCKLKV